MTYLIYHILWAVILLNLSDKSRCCTKRVVEKGLIGTIFGWWPSSTSISLRFSVHTFLNPTICMKKMSALCLVLIAVFITVVTFMKYWQNTEHWIITHHSVTGLCDKPAGFFNVASKHGLNNWSKIADSTITHWRSYTSHINIEEVKHYVLETVSSQGQLRSNNLCIIKVMAWLVGIIGQIT